MLQAELVSPRPAWAGALVIEDALNRYSERFEFQALGQPFLGSAVPRGSVIQIWMRSPRREGVERLFTLARGRDGRFHVKEIAHDQRPQRQARA